MENYYFQHLIIETNKKLELWEERRWLVRVLL